jgi:hypothetical protein
MVHIISKRDGPRREDAEIKRFLGDNRATIGRIAQALTGGGIGQSAPVIEAPPPEAVRSHGYRRMGDRRECRPYIRISQNGRVVIVDFETGRQMHHLGDIRGGGSGRRFVLATRQNGFFAPVDPALADLLAPLDGWAVATGDAEDRLKTILLQRLDLPA